MYFNSPAHVFKAVYGFSECLKYINPYSYTAL